MQKNFFAALFDLSFSEFVTPRLVKVLYVLSLIFIGIYFLFMVVTAFTTSTGAVGTLVTLLLAPVAAIFMVILARFYMELILVIFRMSAKLDKIADKE